MDQIQEIELAKVIPTRDNPRVIRKDDPKTRELADSIRKNGLLQPVLCRPHPTKPGCFDLRAGERRLLAHQMIKAKTILAIVRDLDDQAALEATVIENLQRENLTPIEEARGVKRLLDNGQDVKVIAAEIGKSPQWVVRRAKLADLHPEIVKDYEDPEGDIAGTSVAHLELVSKFDRGTQQRIMAVFKRQAWIWEPNRYGEFAGQIADWTLNLKSVPWKAGDATLDPKAGACESCPKRTSCHPGLFDDEMDPKAIAADDKCLDRDCYNRKMAAHTARKEAELRKEHPSLIKVAADRIPYHQREAMKGIREIDGHTLKKVGKNAPGAKPALVVSGPGSGKLTWVAEGSGAGGRGSGSAGRPVDPETGVSRSMTMEEKRAQLLMRRKAWVCNHVAEQIGGDKCSVFSVLAETESGRLSELALLAAAFGSANRSSSPGELEWKHLADYRVNQEKAAGELWKDVAAVLRERLKFYNTAGCEHQYAEALRVADLVNMPGEKDLLALAAEAIPEPKAWGKPEKS